MSDPRFDTWTKNRLTGQMTHEGELSAAAHWSAEKVAPLVRQLPKTRQTVLDDATIQR
jgi:hypothetical protein